MRRGAGFVAVLVALGGVSGCEERQMAAEEVPLGWADTCLFEATLPKSASFEQITEHFGPRQFCSWISFSERKLRGLAYAKIADSRSGWDKLNGVPLPDRKICDVESLISAGWSVRPIQRTESGREFQALCGGFGIQLNNPTTIPFTETISQLPELCFRVSNEDVDQAIGFSSQLYTKYTLPVRFSRLEGNILRLWFDRGSDVAWASEWQDRVIRSAMEENIILEEHICTI